MRQPGLHITQMTRTARLSAAAATAHRDGDGRAGGCSAASLSTAAAASTRDGPGPQSDSDSPWCGNHVVAGHHAAARAVEKSRLGESEAESSLSVALA